MNLQSIGKNLKLYRKQKHMTQDVVAERAGLSKNYISQIELGLKKPSVETLIKLANAIGVSSDLILADLIDESFPAKVSALNEKIKDLPMEDQRFIFNILDCIIHELNNR